MFYPLLVASGLALGLLAAHWVAADWYGPRLQLNLALAWVPYLCSLWAAGMRSWSSWRRWLLIFPLPLWLAFFPNAPYLLTDFVYIGRISADTWMEVGIFTTFGMCGLYLAVASLYLMHTVVRAAAGELLGWLIVAAATVASGTGIFMGRFLRWNSWELFTHPTALWHAAVARVEGPFSVAGPLAFSAMFSAMIAVFYFMFLSTRRSVATVEELRADERAQPTPAHEAPPASEATAFPDAHVSPPGAPTDRDAHEAPPPVGRPQPQSHTGAARRH